MIRNRKQFSAWVIGLLALSLAGCSEAEVPSATTPGDDPLVNDPTRREIILADFTAAPIVLKNNISGMEDVTVLVSAAAVAP